MIMTIFIMDCSKDISITNFKDDYSDYKQEKRIEAVLVTTDISKSIVRIDNTILVTDTKYFDGFDNDGDWQTFDDQNGNGKWDKDEPLNDDIGRGNEEKGKGNGKPDVGEPHVDEVDEIISQIHDSTYSVKLYNKTDNILMADFKWSKTADDFEFIANPDNKDVERISYGGYIPDNIYYTDISMEKQYEYVINKDEEIISGTFNAQEPAKFFTDNHEFVADTVIIKRLSDDYIYWETNYDGSVFWVLVEKIYSNGQKETIESEPFAAIDQSENGGWIGVEFTSEHAPGLYKMTVYVSSRNYGHYFYSSLPIRDETLNNLRDQDDEVVLGCAGSTAISSIYYRVVE